MAPRSATSAATRSRSTSTWAVEQGITTGCGGTRFCPNAAVTRNQMASFIARALDLPPATHDYFSDDNGQTHEADINKARRSRHHRRLR